MSAYVIQPLANGDEKSYPMDTYLFKERILFLETEVNTFIVQELIKQIRVLDSQDSSKPIIMYINSPGGSVIDGLALYDVMKSARSEIITIVNGMAASMGCYLLSTAGSKRYAMENANIMCHQVSSGSRGHVEDMRISFEQSEKYNTKLMKRIAEAVGVTYDQLLVDCARDKWFDSEEALKYGTKGFIDGIITNEFEDDTKDRRKVITREGVEFINLG